MARTNNPFNGQLNTNAVMSSLYNMVISQQTFGDNIKGTYSELVDAAKVDGTMLGDTKLYISTNCLESYPFGDPYDDAGDTGNILKTKKPPEPKVQAIEINVFRQIMVSTDSYKSKQAFSTEGTFSQFRSVVLGWIRETKRIYDATLYNSYIGTAQSAVQGTHTIDISTATSGLSGLEAKRMEGLTIAQDFSDLLDDLKDISTKYNDYGFLRSYDPSDLLIVLRTDVANQITKLDLPTVFHNQDVDITKICKKIPGRYFGTVLTSTNLKTYATGTAYTAGDFIYDSTGHKVYKVTANITAANNTALTDVTKTELVVRSLGEFRTTVGGVSKHVFAGDVIPTGSTIGAATDDPNFVYGDIYAEDPNKIAVLMHKESVPYMSGFEVSTSFFNPKSLVENNYLTFGHSTLDYLRNYPFLVIKKA